MDLSYDELYEKYFETLLPFPQILLDLPITVIQKAGREEYHYDLSAASWE